MSFTSPFYLLFVGVAAVFFHRLPQTWKASFLVGCSFVFYASVVTPHLLAALALVIIATYGCGLLTARMSGTARTVVFCTGVGLNLVLLAGLKYVPPLYATELAGQGLGDLLVSLGVSYYVFQAIAYLADVYLEMEEPEASFMMLAAYLSFFPKLLQGPIERAEDFLPQLREPASPSYQELRSGLLLFVWGMFKKVIVADRLGLLVDTVYGDVRSFGGATLVLATWFYAFQIYCDFSGYTDMARGAGRLFGFKLTDNFRNPYAATSIAEFWRRWHISFSRWILDYIFKPLQMQWRNYKKAGTAAALLVTFAISGIWHGASFGFLIWGLLHGIFLASSIFYQPWQKKLAKKMGVENTIGQKVVRTFITFNLVCLSWVFFRANNIADATYILTHILSPTPAGGTLLGGHSPEKLLGAFLGLPLVVVVDAVRERPEVAARFWASSAAIRWAAYYSLIIAVVVYGAFGQSDFIYFRF